MDYQDEYSTPPATPQTLQGASNMTWDETTYRCNESHSSNLNNLIIDKSASNVDYCGVSLLATCSGEHAGTSTEFQGPEMDKGGSSNAAQSIFTLPDSAYYVSRLPSTKPMNNVSYLIPVYFGQPEMVIAATSSHFDQNHDVGAEEVITSTNTGIINPTRVSKSYLEYIGEETPATKFDEPFVYINCMDPTRCPENATSYRQLLQHDETEDCVPFQGESELRANHNVEESSFIVYSSNAESQDLHAVEKPNYENDQSCILYTMAKKDGTMTKSITEVEISSTGTGYVLLSSIVLKYSLIEHLQLNYSKAFL